jgi:hypothetical protein
VGFGTQTHEATTKDNYMNELTTSHYHPHALCCVLAIWLFLALAKMREMNHQDTQQFERDYNAKITDTSFIGFMRCYTTFLIILYSARYNLF